MNPEPTTRTPSSRSGRNRRPSSISRAGSWVGRLSCRTGTSACGYITFSGTQAPWSSPRPAATCTGSVSGISAATASASPCAAGVGYVIR